MSKTSKASTRKRRKTLQRRSMRAARPDFSQLESRQMLTTFVVDTIVDSPVSAQDGLVSLREAIVASNSNTANGDASAGSADGDVIRFSPSLAGLTIQLTGGELEISDDLRIQGGSRNITIDALGNSRIFNVDSTEQVSIGRMTLTGGLADEGGAIFTAGSGATVLSQMTLSNNTATGDGGGAVYVESGEFYATNSDFSENQANGNLGSGGAIFQADGSVGFFGGKMLSNVAFRDGGAIEIVDGEFFSSDLDVGDVGAGNVASPLRVRVPPGNGGGLHVTGEARTIINGGSWIGNTAASRGGALWNQANSSMFLNDVVITGNFSLGGGGVFNDGGTLAITGGTISDNFAIFGNGGGIYTTAGNVDLRNVTITGNSADRAGGGIEVIDGTVNIQNSVLGADGAGNIAGSTSTNGSGNPGNGGGLHISGNAATVILGNTTVRSNYAASEGGGLWNQSGSFIRVNRGSIIEGNVADGDDADEGGGGIFNNGGRVSILDAQITSNTALGDSGSGGGIFSTDGRIFVLNSTIAANQASNAGGGIEVLKGQVNLIDSTLGGELPDQGNVAGPTGSAGRGTGGGLHVEGNQQANVFLENVVVKNNSAATEGGGLWNSGSGLLRIQDSTIDSNVALGGDRVLTGGRPTFDAGGGIFNDNGNLTVIGSAISNNKAATGSGGGVFTIGGRALFFDTDITVNNAEEGGGVANSIDRSFIFFKDSLVSFNLASGQFGEGGGLHVDGNDSTAVVRDSVFSSNTATTSGGGIWNAIDTTLVLQGSTEIVGNSAFSGQGGGIYNQGTLSALDSIFSNNSADVLDGGAIFNTRAGTSILTNLEIDNNVSGRAGGGVANFGVLRLSGSNVVSNVAEITGGGLFTNDSGNFFRDRVPGTFESNNTFSNNSPQDRV